jgi:porin
MGKLAGVTGQFWKIRAEHRFGDTINRDTGAFVPATVLPDLPVRDSEHVYLTNVMVTQALSENFAVVAGKMDTLDGDPNAYATGRGKTQFSNMAMVANLAPLLMFPYSSLGAGCVVLSDMQPVAAFTVLNATDTTRTSGFDELFNDGATLTGFVRLPTAFFDRPGHQLVGGSWSSKNFVSLGQDPRVILPDQPIERESDSWSVFWNCDQALIVDPQNPARHWGYFARAGMADDESSLIEYFLSAGLGGASPLASRPGDTWGVGWYHIGVSDEIGPIIETVLGPISDGDGVELYYNTAVTPWCHITPDMQIIMPGRDVVDESLVVGVRANIDL